MSTNADAIKDAVFNGIIAAMATFPNIDHTNPAVIDLVTAISTGIGVGVYAELQNLDDTAGTPPSTGHV